MNPNRLLYKMFMIFEHIHVTLYTSCENFTVIWLKDGKMYDIELYIFRFFVSKIHIHVEERRKKNFLYRRSFIKKYFFMLKALKKKYFKNKRENSSKISYNSNEIKWLLNWKIEKKEVFSIFQILTQSTFLVCHSFSTLDCNRKNCIKLSCNTCNTFNLKIKEHTFWQKKITSTKMKI
jgi:hypothetical protein